MLTGISGFTFINVCGKETSKDKNQAYQNIGISLFLVLFMYKHMGGVGSYRDLVF